MQNFRVLASILTEISNFLPEGHREGGTQLVSEGPKMKSSAFAQRAKAELKIPKLNPNSPQFKNFW